MVFHGFFVEIKPFTIEKYILVAASTISIAFCESQVCVFGEIHFEKGNCVVFATSAVLSRFFDYFNQHRSESGFLSLSNKIDNISILLEMYLYWKLEVKEDTTTLQIP